VAAAGSVQRDDQFPGTPAELPAIEELTRRGAGVELSAITAELEREGVLSFCDSWDYAFAMGHGCSIGPDPRFDRVRREVADEAAIIAEHAAAEPTP
jgi:hypothetical protein